MSRTYFWWLRGPAHKQMAMASMESVRRADPRACRVLVTDQDLAEPPDITVAIDNFPELPLMAANLEAIWRVLTTLPHYGDELVVLDADTLVLSPLHLLDAASLAVTWRPAGTVYTQVGDDENAQTIDLGALMPFNFGVLALRHDRYALEAVLWMRERVRRMSMTRQVWYGNQMALAELAGPVPAEGLPYKRDIRWDIGEHAVNSIAVRAWPCEQWNYTPSAPGEDTSGRRVLHFKGNSRGLMEGYAKAMNLPWEGP